MRKFACAMGRECEKLEALPVQQHGCSSGNEIHWRSLWPKFGSSFWNFFCNYFSKNFWSWKYGFYIARIARRVAFFFSSCFTTSGAFSILSILRNHSYQHEEDLQVRSYVPVAELCVVMHSLISRASRPETFGNFHVPFSSWSFSFSLACSLAKQSLTLVAVEEVEGDVSLEHVFAN